MFVNSSQNKVVDTYRFFLYFFDEIGGHTPLFTFPEDSLDKNEEQILSIHPVWWHQEKFLNKNKFLTMDLELEGVVYSATLFFCQAKRKKRRSGMDSSKWEEERFRFVLIARSPASVSFIAHEILYELKSRIEGNIGEKLCILVESYLSTNEQEEVREFLAKQSKTVELQLRKMCQDLVPKTPLTKLEAHLESKKISETQEQATVQEKKLVKPKMLRFSIPKAKKQDKLDISKKKILEPIPKRIKIAQIIHNPENNRIQVKMINKDSRTFDNVDIKIIQSEGFFKKDVLVKPIKEWVPGKELMVEFEPISDIGAIYFLRIEDEHETIRIKRILG
jgi:hypothetical protein